MTEARTSRAGALIDVVVVDDHVALRQGLEALLARRGCRIAGTAATVAESKELLAARTADVAIVDLRLPDGSGVDLVEWILREHPAIKVLVYTGADDPDVLARALDTEAHGFVLKPGSLDELVSALRAVSHGERVVDERIGRLLERRPAPDSALSRREREVFRLLADGLSGEEIAARLYLSPETVRTHIRNGMTKLGARTRTQAVVAAVARGEIDGK